MFTKKLLIIALLFLSSLFSLHGQQLVINEFSQGNTGVREYIELLVVGNRGCNGDSCMDIRGWIVDDNNGWCGAGAGQGIATGHMRFTNDPNWSCVPYGSIILLYNIGDINTSITLVDDPTDSNNDNVYVVPSNSMLLEHTTATPVSPSAPNYVYPAVTYNAGGNWSTIGMANGGDAVIITAPSNLAAAHHSLAFGATSSGVATIYKSQSGAARVYALQDDQYTAPASYTVGNAPVDETPGFPNSTLNAAWINGMLTNTTGTIDTDIEACITLGGSYNFNGTLLTATGLYHDTLPSSTNCDSIIHLTLTVLQPSSATNIVSGCNSVVYNGVTYTGSTMVNDTVFSFLGCDSIYNQTFINIQQITPLFNQDTISGCQSIVYKGIAYNQSQIVTDTMRTTLGCDSVITQVYLNILPLPVITLNPKDTIICLGAGVTLSASSNQEVRWTGFPIGSDITVFPEQTTIYTVEAYNELNCISMGSVTVHVEDFHIRFAYDPTPAEAGLPVTINTSSDVNYNVLQWFPETIFNNQDSKSQTVTLDKKLEVSVIGKSSIGCIDTASMLIEVLPAPYVFLPTAFTPNGDGLNDFFAPIFIRDFAIRDFSIFNRWGQKVYGAHTKQQMAKGWDGSLNGQPCELGNYYYLLSAENQRGEDISLKGDVLLAR